MLLGCCCRMRFIPCYVDWGPVGARDENIISKFVCGEVLNHVWCAQYLCLLIHTSINENERAWNRGQCWGTRVIISGVVALQQG